jgi:thiamine-phosphate pyrophosphorylase
VRERGRAILCLVTDRRRLSARLGCDFAAVDEALLAQVGAAADAGVDMVQIREGDLPAAALAELTRRVVTRLRDTVTRVLVNDRADVALACHAHGVHLKATSMTPRQTRRIGPQEWLIGASVHGDGLERARGADYLIAGTLRPTPSKPAAAPLLGIDGLRRIARAAHPVPVLGIGGLTADDVPALKLAGAAGLAGIEVFLPTSSPHFEESVHRAVARLRLAFDSSEHVS